MYLLSAYHVLGNVKREKNDGDPTTAFITL